MDSTENALENRVEAETELKKSIPMQDTKLDCLNQINFDNLDQMEGIMMDDIEGMIA